MSTWSKPYNRIAFGLGVSLVLFSFGLF